MSTWIIFPLFLWALVGLLILRSEMEKGNKKLIGMSFFFGLTVIGKALFFGPFTYRKVLSKL